MQLHSIIKQEKKLAVPTKLEQQKIESITKEILNKVNNQLKKNNINAKLLLGGSVAKGTWLSGISDIDFFLVFNYDEYSNKSSQISDVSQNVLRTIFKIQRLRGSRDYFVTNFKNFNIEIVPVLDINKGQQAKNITDFSPLHINWIKKNSKSDEMSAQIRLAKHGAESHIRGLSGYAIEILTIYYGSFEKLLKGILKWQERQVIDAAGHYEKQKLVFEKLSSSKLQSPVIVVDPVEPNRNAAAALDKEKFLLAKTVSAQFLEKPSLAFFKEKPFSISDLKNKAKDLKLVVLLAKVQKGKPDIIGSALLKKFQEINAILKTYEFVAQDSGWHWPEKGSAHYWFYFDKTPLPATKIHFGPPVRLEKFAREFRKKWRKVKTKNGKLSVEVKRKYRLPEELFKEILKKDKSLKLIN